MPIDNDGSAVLPTFSFLSETSLGFWRSGASVLALSYGTADISILSSNTVSAANRLYCVVGGNIVGEFTSSNLIIIPASYSIIWNNNNSGDVGTPSFGPRNVFANTAVMAAAGTALRPSLAISSESSLGFYSSGVSTLAPSYGTLNLKSGNVNLSMTTLAAATSAVDSGLAIVMRASGLSLVYKSGGTIYVLATSSTSGTA